MTLLLVALTYELIHKQLNVKFALKELERLDYILREICRDPNGIISSLNKLSISPTFYKGSARRMLLLVHHLW